VKLQDLSTDKKIAVIDIGQKATVYMSEPLLRQTAVQVLNDFNKKEISKIIQLLDSKSLKSDTITLDQFLPDLTI